MMVGDLVRLKYNPGLHKGPLTGRIVSFFEKDERYMDVELIDHSGELVAWGREPGTVFYEHKNNWVVVPQGPEEASKIADYYDTITA